MASRAADALSLAVVGANGAVGTEILNLVVERAFPFSELRLYSSELDATRSLQLQGKSYRIEALEDPAELAQVDVAFLAVPAAVAAPIVAKRPGPMLVDLSAHNLAPASIPMVAPGFTQREQIIALGRGAIVHLPHPVAHALAALLAALEGLRAGVATVILSASLGGKQEVERMVVQSADLLNGRLEVKEDERQRAFNLLPLPGARQFNETLLAQVAHLLGSRPALVLQTLQGALLHGIGLTLAAVGDARATQWSASLTAAPGILVVEDEEPPSVVDAIGQEALLVSVAQAGQGANLWCVFDNARRAALNALWVAESLLAKPDTLN